MNYQIISVNHIWSLEPDNLWDEVYTKFEVFRTEVTIFTDGNRQFEVSERCSVFLRDDYIANLKPPYRSKRVARSVAYDKRELGVRDRYCNISGDVPSYRRMCKEKSIFDKYMLIRDLICTDLLEVITSIVFN